jgi:hypothetical protein
MINKLFYSGPYPVASRGVVGKNIDLSKTMEVFAPAAEIARPEYNYVFNKDGLRSVEFSTKPNVIAIGCSITLGQGLPIDARWSNILERLLINHGEFSVGNIAHSGASAAKGISSFFGMVHKYEYIPQIVICNFANFERLWFTNSSGEYIQDYFPNSRNRLFKAQVPYEFGRMIPLEWCYFTNLDHIKMLEAFCATNNILLIWSTWSTNLDETDELFLSSEFKNYYPDPTRFDFPDNFEYAINVDSPEKLNPYFSMIGWDNFGCHRREYDENMDIFNFAYDYHKHAGEWGPGAHWPHYGLHRHIHWAEFYYEIIKQTIDIKKFNFSI